MITGRVTEDGNPKVTFSVAGRDWPAIIDTGFNGDLQLPEVCCAAMDASYVG